MRQNKIKRQTICHSVHSVPEWVCEDVTESVFEENRKGKETTKKKQRNVCKELYTLHNQI